MSWGEWLEEFSWWKSASGLSERTVKDYQTHVKRFYGEHPETQEDNLKKAVYMYMAKPCKPAYFNLKLTYLKAFFKWCVEQKYIQNNPLEGFHHRKAEARIVLISDATIIKLLSLPDVHHFAGMRDYALLMLSLDTGARPCEALHLLPADVNLHSLEVTIRSEIAKTRTARTLPISPNTAKAIYTLQKIKAKFWHDDNLPVFCSADGTVFHMGSWTSRLRIYSKQLDKLVSPQCFRHIFALKYLKKHTIFELQRMLGHSTLDMCNHYLAITSVDLKAGHLKSSPLEDFLPHKKRLVKI